MLSVGGLEVIFHEKVTANNDVHTGIQPLVALESHRANLRHCFGKRGVLSESKILNDAARVTSTMQTTALHLHMNPQMRLSRPGRVRGLHPIL